MNEYEQYAVLCAQAKEIGDKKAALAKIIIEKMEIDHLDKVESPLGKFKVTKLKKWTYPKFIEDLGEEFEVAKAKAQSTGDATYEESASLRFTPDSSI